MRVVAVACAGADSVMMAFECFADVAALVEMWHAAAAVAVIVIVGVADKRKCCCCCCCCCY